MKGAKTLCRLTGKDLVKKLSDVPNAGNVLHAELEAANPILQPMEAHVAGLRHLWSLA